MTLFDNIYNAILELLIKIGIIITPIIIITSLCYNNIMVYLGYYIIFVIAYVFICHIIFKIRDNI